MSAIDRFNEVSRQRKMFLALRWTITTPSVRMFEDGEPTREYTPTERDLGTIQAACGVTEHDGGPDISYASSYELGNAVKKVTVRYLDKQIGRLAKEAESEAREILKLLNQERE